MAASSEGFGDRSIYVIEVAGHVVLGVDPSGATDGWLYVGWTKHPHEVRLAQHMNADDMAASAFVNMVEALGRPLRDDEAWLRPDLATEAPRGDSERQANRAERRQANRLANQGFTILSSHKHGMKKLGRR